MTPSLDWDLEIRKRFAQPLFSEAIEFPDPDNIQSRILPICYEEGVTGGCSPGCAELMNIATEYYIKEFISNILIRIKSNGDNYIKTATYQRQLQQEEDAWLQGGVVRSSGGLLPIEVQASERRRPIEFSDMRLALHLGNSYVGQTPLLTEKMAGNDNICVKKKQDEEKHSLKYLIAPQGEEKSKSSKSAKEGNDTNTVSNLSWQGGTVSDRLDLMMVLEDCLAVG